MGASWVPRGGGVSVWEFCVMHPVMDEELGGGNWTCIVVLLFRKRHGLGLVLITVDTQPLGPTFN